MSLKTFFKDQIISPVFNNRGEVFKKPALITKSIEINNVCSIEYIDKDDIRSNRDNVPVRIFEPGIQSWFPEVGEWVMIEEYKGEPMIIGILPGHYADTLRGELSMDNDILPDDISGDSSGGYVY